MPFINLIHEQRQAIRLQERKTKFAMIGLITSLAVSTSAWGLIWLQSEGAKGESQVLQAQVDKMEPVLKAIEASEMQFNALSPRLTTLQDAAMNTQRWARVLDHLSHHMPSGVWLTQMRCSQTSSTEPIKVELQGMSPNQDAASEFILRLQASEDLDDVNLKYTQGDQVNEKPVIRFEVSGSIVGTAKEAPVTEETKEEGS